MYSTVVHEDDNVNVVRCTTAARNKKMLLFFFPSVSLFQSAGSTEGTHRTHRTASEKKNYPFPPWTEQFTASRFFKKQKKNYFVLWESKGCMCVHMCVWNERTLSPANCSKLHKQCDQVCLGVCWWHIINNEICGARRCLWRGCACEWEKKVLNSTCTVFFFVFLKRPHTLTRTTHSIGWGCLGSSWGWCGVSLGISSSLRNKGWRLLRGRAANDILELRPKTSI